MDDLCCDQVLVLFCTKPIGQRVLVFARARERIHQSNLQFSIVLLETFSLVQYYRKIICGRYDIYLFVNYGLCNEKVTFPTLMDQLWLKINSICHKKDFLQWKISRIDLFILVILIPSSPQKAKDGYIYIVVNHRRLEV